MKAFTLLLTLLLLPFDAWSAPRDDLRHNQRVRRAAMELFRSDSTASALSHLRRTLRPEAAAGGDQTTLAQSLIEIAGEFYNRRELPLARQAALQAQLAAEPILAGRSPRRAAPNSTSRSVCCTRPCCLTRKLPSHATTPPSPCSPPIP
jgi:hypothetical protein